MLVPGGTRLFGLRNPSLTLRVNLIQGTAVAAFEHQLQVGHGQVHADLIAVIAVGIADFFTAGDVAASRSHVHSSEPFAVSVPFADAVEQDLQRFMNPRSRSDFSVSSTAARS